MLDAGCGKCDVNAVLSLPRATGRCYDYGCHWYCCSYSVLPRPPSTRADGSPSPALPSPVTDSDPAPAAAGREESESSIHATAATGPFPRVRCSVYIYTYVRECIYLYMYVFTFIQYAYTHPTHLFLRFHFPLYQGTTVYRMKLKLTSVLLPTPDRTNRGGLFYGFFPRRVCALHVIRVWVA